MTKQELIERVVSTLGEKLSRGEDLPKKTIAVVVDSVFAELGAYFTKAKITAKRVPRFTYPGFGTFTKKERAARTGRDPRSGDVIEIPALTTVGFQPGQDLREKLNTRRSSDPKKKAHG